MEGFRKLRTALRASFTKTVNTLNEELRKEECDDSVLSDKLTKLERSNQELKELDHKIMNLLLETEVSVEDLETELEKAEEYSDTFITMNRLTNERLGNMDPVVSSSRSGSVRSTNRDKTYRLPKIEIRKFDGELINWLPFWAQFKKIHEDEEIHDSDKFQYLLQAMQPASRAKEFIESYPMTAENYGKAVKALEERFGKKDLLVEVYVRELLKLIISNVRASSKDRLPLFKLFDKIEAQLRALESMGITTETNAAWLFPMVESCLSEDIIKAWQRSVLFGNEEKPRINNLMEFLRKEVEGEERLHLAKSGFGCESQKKRMLEIRSPHVRMKHVPTAAELLSATVNKRDSSGKTCVFCEKCHVSSECRYALTLTLEERKQNLIKKGVCFKCLNRGHVSRFCTIKVNCSMCGGRHFSVMCTAKSNNPLRDKISLFANSEQNLSSDCALTNHTSRRQVLLQTMVVRIRGVNKEKLIRVLIDTGSQRSYISKYAASVMGYEKLREEEIIHSLFGGTETLVNHKRYLIRLCSTDRKYCCRFEVLDQEKICSHIARIEFGSFMKEVKTNNIYLTDMTHVCDNLLYEDSPLEIHVLIGADVAGKLFTGKMKQLKCGLVCMETLLGWTIMGKTKNFESKDSTNTVISLHVNDAKISDLWRLDTLGILDPGEKGTKEELEAATKEHFIRNLKRHEDGRYEVSLPWIQGHPPLTNCRSIAERRLKTCVKSLVAAGKLEVYEAVLNDWLKEGIIEELDFSREEREGEHYLPHRAVIKENSTTKVRPVFDGSARERDSPSINDCLEKGPNTVELIPSVINRFRLKKIGVIADIRKAFLQIGLNERDRPYLKFLWWDGGDCQKLKIFQHRRVVFGLSCSPYLLGATIEYHLLNAPEYLKETAKKLIDSFYVDNCVTSVDNKDELDKFVTEAKLLLGSAKFDLRGWEYSGRGQGLLMRSGEKDVSVLGLNWKLDEDSLSIDFRENLEEDRVITKRRILSTVHRIFDPVGFTCAVTLGPKVLLQECWRKKMSWDTELPVSMRKKFEKWEKQIVKLRDISIPRCLILNVEGPCDLSLHVFCDASKIAYATCIFLRSENENSVFCQLVQARNRVAPMKEISIPRLELLACNIGARLVQTVKNDLGMKDIPTVYWSDSGNALYWIKKNECWAPFVYNRVQEIRSLSNPADWRYVPGSLNPADLPSRGCNAAFLAESRWWEGPDWLREPCEKWPMAEVFPDLEIVNSEKRKTVVCAVNTEEGFEGLYGRFSSYNRLLRVVGWMNRFSSNSKCIRTDRISGNLSNEEIKKAEMTLMKLVQRETFSGSEDKRLKNLPVMIDSHGLLRFKTRILRREDTESFRFPIILPSQHPVVRLLIIQGHEELLHSGVSVLMTHLRENFWILKTRQTIRRVINKCVRCRRFNSRKTEVIPAPLPEDRVREATVFEIVGIDLTGPLYLKGGNKAWIVIFTCAVYRTVHLELVTSLSTEEFLQTLRRFIARRGRPAVIYSDNGTNFVGANRALKQIDWSAISASVAVQRIKWKFNPPSAAWWGGWWERLIKMIKQILRKILGQASLNYEELNTVICECEQLMNSRPLTYVSEDTEELAPLTPSMFLQEIRTSGVPDIDILDHTGFNKRVCYRQILREHLRKRFRIEYLGQLRTQTFRHREMKPLSEGDVVLIEDDNKKRSHWLLARVLELYPGRDGYVRVARLKTSSGEMLRPVQRLYNLEIQNDHLSLPERGNSIKRTRSGRKVIIPERFR